MGVPVPPTIPSASVQLAEELRLAVMKRDDVIRAKDKLIARLELKLHWTRRWNEAMRERAERLIDEILDRDVPAVENAAEKERKKEGTSP